MKRMAKRLISMALVLLLSVQLVPVPALAALLDNDPAYNREILNALTEMVGSEDEASRYYAMLEHYGLLDEDGNLSESWEIWMDGEQVTLEDIRTFLADPNCDLEKYVLVDGQPITLGDIETILAIEDYLAYLQETYFDGHKWTAEQQASLQSLIEQIEREGITLTTGDTLPVGGAGISHAARVDLTMGEVSDGTVTVTASLRGAAPGQQVSFDWAALSGSQPVSGSGTVNMTADESGSAETTFDVELEEVTTDTVRSTADLAFYIKADNITNALFGDGNMAVDAIALKHTTSGTLETLEEIPGIDGFDVGTSQSYPYPVPALSDEYRQAVAWGAVDTIRVSMDPSYKTGKDNLVTFVALDDQGKRTFAPLPNTFADIIEMRNLNPNPGAAGEDIGVLYFETLLYSAKLGNATSSAVYEYKYNGNTVPITASSKTEDYFVYSARPANDATLSPEDAYGTFNLTGTQESRNYKLGKNNNSYTVEAMDDDSYDRHFWTIAHFTNSAPPSVQGISAPAGTYYPGQVVPVTVTFNEPVDAASARVKFHGDDTAYAAAEGDGYSNVLTFPYTVQAVDNQTLRVDSVTATDTKENTLSNYSPDAGDSIVDGVTLSTPVKADAITGITAAIGGTITDNTLEVTVGITNDEDMTAWMTPETDENGLYADGLTVSLDGGTTMHNLYFAGNDFSDGLTTSIPLALNTGEEALVHMAELYLDGELLIGKYAATEQAPVIFIEESDLTVTIDTDGYAFENDADPVIYVQSDMPTLKAALTLADKAFAFGNMNKTAVYGTEAAETADFIWQSSDTTVAAIDAEGNITPTGKAGSTVITLTARNGGVDGKAVTVTATYTAGEYTHNELQFAAGLTPFLLIPNDQLSVTDGADATVYWTSNLCDKNGEVPTTFTVTVTQGVKNIYSTTVSGTAADPAASVVIPGEVLTYNYDAAGSNRYTVTVSAVYAGATYEDEATIDLEAQPAQVALGYTGSHYILDTAGSISIPWAVDHLDKADGENQSEIFRFEISRGSDPVETGIALDLENGSAGGVFELDIANVSAGSDPTGYRAVYTVTLQAKNGTQSTWSYDSFLLYVYDADALKIMVDGAAANSTTMSNVSAISKMSQAQILALKRDIYLKNIISANYGQYAWTEVADQIAWASSDSSVASINYQQGTLYENIENFEYVSYRPTTDFGLAGLDDGRATITAQHKLTGMTETLTVDVETLEDKLYLFQCYPQAQTTLRYQDSTGRWQEILSDPSGAAAIYEEKGIHSNVYCASTVDGTAYLGTFHLSGLETGEGDWTKLERYPCNNLTMRQAAYAYLYLKNPDGTPYTGEITFRGGVYVNGTYVEDALFGLNGHPVTQKGYEDNSVDLKETGGRLTVTMDQTQWPGGMVSAQDDVQYVFEIAPAGTELYPLLQTVDATVNIDAYVGNGEAVVTFRSNPETGAHPFVAAQTAVYTGYNRWANVLDTTGKIGPNGNFGEVVLNTTVLWWGEDLTDQTPGLQLFDESGHKLAAGEGQYTLTSDLYPFTSSPVTAYSTKLNQSTMDTISLRRGSSTGLVLEYYPDGTQLSRKETLPFQLINMIGVEKVENAKSITTMLSTMGQATDTNDKKTQDLGDKFVNVALDLVAGDSYSTGDDKLFRIQLTPTSDPSKFLGFIEANVGNMRDKDQVTGVYAPGSESGDQDLDYVPGLSEIMTAFGKRSIYSYLMDDFNHVLKREKVRNLKMQIGGYAESLIYYSEVTGKWEIQVLGGGFNLGGGVTYSWNWNTFAGPVPLTATLTIGGTAEVMMDALTVSYYNATRNQNGVGNDFLTQLRVYLYLHFFAGVGIDYAIIAFKLGIYGQISLNMEFAWLNRPYLLSGGDIIYNVADGSSIQDGEVNLDGQRFKIDGQIGLEFVVRILFFAYEKILFSYSFNLMDEATRDYETIYHNWNLNKEAQMSAISALLGKRALTVQNVGGQQMLALNLAPTLESRDYLENGSHWDDGGFSFFALDAENGLSALQYNAYPYANPVLTDDGGIVAYLSDEGSENVEDTRAAFALRNSSGKYDEGTPIDDGAGFGDSQIAISGSHDFAAAAWTRQMSGIDKDAGAVLTDEDQMIMLNSAEIYAAVYDDGTWETARLTDNGLTDLAPVVAAKNGHAIVAWRAVAPSDEKTAEGFANITDFEEKDTILYRIYDNGAWSAARTLYNGTSGAVKGITAAMMQDGTAAVAYTLDTDGDDATITDREILYAVIDDASGEVIRNVRATKDAYLDENPQLTTTTFPAAGGEERFVLGWYTEQAVSGDTAVTLDGGDDTGTGETTADIRLLDFDAKGIYTQLLPDSISQAAAAYDVAITPSFRFTKNADSINDLSILWVERAAELDRETEKDTLKGVKFYTYGQHDELIRFTGAVNVAEMDDGTLIDHFDAYVSDPETNEIKAVILGSTYGADGTVTRTGTTVGGDTVQYTVPSRTTSMYTATETYQDKIEVPDLLADYETIRKGAKTEILFTVDNNGIHAIEQLEITLSDGEETYTTVHKDLNLLPGSSMQLYADYVVPADKVVDLDYTVQATFDESLGATGHAETTETTRTGLLRSSTQDLTKATGKVYLDFPDLEITEASVIREADGERTILVKLNNAADADLAGADRWVQIGFYSDATCEHPIEGLDPITVDALADLAMIDAGGYSVSAVLDVKQVLASVSDADHPITEIPENGIQVFVKADILENVPGEETPQVAPEIIFSNNAASVVCENLQTRTGADAILTSTLATDGSGSTVTVRVQNTRLSETASGNIIVTLLDKAGNVLGQQQSYTGSGGLLTLAGEEEKTLTFAFSGDGIEDAASAQVVYADLILDEPDNAALTSLRFSNIPGITVDSFVPDGENTYRASASVSDVTSTAVMAVAASGAASIRLSDKETGGNVLAKTLRLYPGTTQEITVAVTCGAATRTYVLTVENSDSNPDRSPASHPVEIESGAHGTVSAKPTSAAVGTTVTLTVTPDAGYRLESLTATTKRGTVLELTAQGGGKYTFRMPDGTVFVEAVFAESPGAHPFGDVDEDAYYAEAVAWAVDNGITNGVGANVFAPNAICTRAQVVTFLWRAAGEPAPESGEMPFTDVPADAYYYDAVLWAVENGITNGTSADAFSPNATVTRGQTVTFLWRAEHGDEMDGEHGFVDVASDAYYHDAVLWAVENDVTNGTSNITFSPDNGCTRGQIVTFLYRTFAE